MTLLIEFLDKILENQPAVYGRSLSFSLQKIRCTLDVK